ncbi:MAG: hypothetical protein R3331_01770 [Sulfurospirillaceae bacterium]|nr:hypothetical protein [Sulfurospirillaceae bacterium]
MRIYRLFPFVVLLCTSITLYAVNTGNPKYLGTVSLNEIIMKPNTLIVNINSNGCTDKKSLKIDVQKDTSISNPEHYILNIKRIKPDLCNNFIPNGKTVFFDLNRDLNITGQFSYSVVNGITSVMHLSENNDSSTALSKNVAQTKPLVTEVQPKSFKKFSVMHNYFTTEIPTSWKLSYDVNKDQQNGIFEIRLTKSNESNTSNTTPEPMIYVGFYDSNNTQKETYDVFINEYKKLAQKRAGDPNYHYEDPKTITLNGLQAMQLSYEVYKNTDKLLNQFWMQANFILLKTQEGFYVLAYKSPKEFYEKFLPIFNKVKNTFNPGIF